jgi:hypothetical protein
MRVWNWLQTLQIQGLKPRMRVLRVIEDGESPKEAEGYFIEQFRETGKLLNQHLTTPGDHRLALELRKKQLQRRIAG